MSFWERLFNKSQSENQINNPSVIPKDEVPEAEWEPIPAYIAADPADYHIVSIIASAIAAGAYPDSQFVVKRILQRNPQALELSLITASIAAAESSDSQLVVKRIYQKKSV